MLRAGARVARLGTICRIASQPPLQIRWNSQLQKRQEQVARASDGKVSRTVARRGGTKSSNKKKTLRIESSRRSSSAIQSTKSQPPLLYTSENLQQIYELPTSTQYGLSLKSEKNRAKLLKESGLVTSRKHEALPRKKTGGQHMIETTVRLKGEDGVTWTCKGHGQTPKKADEAAYLHVVCKLHESGELSKIVSRVTQYLEPGPRILRLESNAKQDVIDYAARHDCLPVFSFGQMSRSVKGGSSGTRAHASIPALGLNGYGRGNGAAQAIHAACISLKRAAEARHGETGEGTLLVKDYTHLTTHSAPKFVRFYCQHQGLTYSDVTEPGKPSKTGGEHITILTLGGADPSNDIELSGVLSTRSNAKPVSDVDAWPAVTKDADDLTRKYEGIPMMSKIESEATANLVAAMALKQESARLWEKFVKEMRRGFGDLLRQVSPIDIALSPSTVEIMEDTLQQTSDVEHQQFTASQSKDDQEQKSHRARNLNEEANQRKNEDLLKRLNYYETEPSLAESRRLRRELPMSQYREKVMEMINANDVCVVVGATGSGKTTQVPQLILDDLIRKGKGSSCNVICTQPRRIAAVSVAQRVAQERNELLRQSIGYSVRFDSKPPQVGGSVHYLTTGVLLKQLEDGHSSALDGISHVIVDEVHERDINNDFLLIVLKNLLQDRRKAGQPAIKIILMSATINTSLFCRYFGEGYPNKMCPHIEVPGRTFPVTTHHLDEISVELKKTYSSRQAFELYTKQTEDYIVRELNSRPQSSSAPAQVDLDSEASDNKSVINWNSTGVIGDDGEIDIAISKEDALTPVGLMGVTIAHILKTTTEGSILVFLPGLQEILDLEKQLNQTRPLGIDFANNPDYKVYLLHSSLPQMQQDVFLKSDSGQRKIILATNIAETSITIPDVIHVVDSSKQRETQYDRTRRITSLVSAWTAKSNARQRAGRAGRVQHGHYYTMASEARYHSFDISTKAEILRTDLQSLCLQIKSMGIQDVRAFLNSAIEPPGQSAVETAMNELQSLGALDQNEALTPLGRYISSLPLSPAHAKMVVLGAIFKCLDPMLILAAVQTARNPFLRPPDKRNEADRRREKWGLGTGSDHAAFINVFKAWRELKNRGRAGHKPEMQFAYDNFLHNDTMKTIARTADQILDTLRSTGLIDDRPGAAYADQYGSESENTYSTSHALQVALATAGFYPNIAVRRRGSNPRFLRTASENEVSINPYSLAAPKTVDGRAYSRIADESVPPPGSLFTFCDKTQADNNGVTLRSVSQTYPLAVFLFGGRSSVEGNVVTIDEWIPFYVPKREKFLLQRFNSILDNYLERTFSQLSSAKEHRRSKRDPHLNQVPFLNQDKVRDRLVEGVARALESCAPNGSGDKSTRPIANRSMLLSGIDGTYPRSDTNILRQDRPSPFGRRSDSTSGRFSARSREGEARSGMEIRSSSGRSNFEASATRHQSFGERQTAPRERLSFPTSTARVSGASPGRSVLDLLQKWNK